ncbi:Hemolysin-type calcium-binding repeat-containing protein [Paracoccus isoporae]|uniref:Hemolysin-type calcium-binding repeat-containing protein n=1 Tax=Paracoccus isoporae TaxID=591205 RepID=A0A1G6W8Z3_9RHOB|nr:calcium-binding protein [Paracoccus isoporae]SDD62284.1 Hemolysin-type calcium-binding repeat-containing protein [Paracoccus isoporae]
MRIIKETPDEDLYGHPVPPDGEEAVKLTAPGSTRPLGRLTEGELTTGYVHDTTFKGLKSFDYDTFVLDLDAGDTYQIEYKTDNIELQNVIRGFWLQESNPAPLSFFAIIMNGLGGNYSYDDFLPVPGTPMLTEEFTAPRSGRYVLQVRQFPVIELSRTADDEYPTPYTLKLKKTNDVTPWSVKKTIKDGDYIATLSAGERILPAGVPVEISMTFNGADISLDSIWPLLAGSFSSTSSSNNGDITITAKLVPEKTVKLSDVLAVKILADSGVDQIYLSSVDIGNSDFPGSEPVEVPSDMRDPDQRTETPAEPTDGDDGHQEDTYRDDSIGDAHPNTLTGTTAGEWLEGGDGDDLYNISARGVRVVEGADGGEDTVYSSVNFWMYDNLENLSLTGRTAVTGAGNGLDNVIAGNDRGNILKGKAGDDTLKGWGGDDRLEGGAGVDKMFGGKGNDRYLVDHAGDKVIEAPGAGIDTVVASTNYQLGGHVENLILRSPGPVNGAGNYQANKIEGTEGVNLLRGLPGNDTLIGWGGDDTLDGGWGADKMFGGKGNDRYVVDNLGDRVIEGPQTGIDTVLSSVDFQLSAALENLHLVGPNAVSGTGNAKANVMSGNHAANLIRGHEGADAISGQGGFDRIVGGKGNDLLNGGAGRDTFVFFQNDGRDVIQDFKIGADLIEFRTIDGGNFSELGISQQGGKAVVAFGGTTVVLNGTASGQLDADDFLFV